jgi:hypothetical protein
VGCGACGATLTLVASRLDLSREERERCTGIETNGLCGDRLALGGGNVAGGAFDLEYQVGGAIGVVGEIGG